MICLYLLLLSFMILCSTLSRKYILIPGACALDQPFFYDLKGMSLWQWTQCDVMSQRFWCMEMEEGKILVHNFRGGANSGACDFWKRAIPPPPPPVNFDRSLKGMSHMYHLTRLIMNDPSHIVQHP